MKTQLKKKIPFPKSLSKNLFISYTRANKRDMSPPCGPKVPTPQKYKI